jgi:hypothetical protein
VAGVIASEVHNPMLCVTTCRKSRRAGVIASAVHNPNWRYTTQIGRATAAIKQSLFPFTHTLQGLCLYCNVTLACTRRCLRGCLPTCQRSSAAGRPCWSWPTGLCLCPCICACSDCTLPVLPPCLCCLHIHVLERLSTYLPEEQHSRQALLDLAHRLMHTSGFT